MHYDGLISADFDDRALAHLQLVVTAKLRRGESFTFTWSQDVATGSGRTMVWVHPGVSLAFQFYGGRAPRINRAWLDELMMTANSSGGLHLVSEPAERFPAVPSDHSPA